jgi:hypothetical protein
MNNITKTTKTILFASLIAALILPFSAMNFADAETDNNKADRKAIHDELKNADASEKKALTERYLVKNQELNDSIHKTLQRDYVAEWKTIDLVSIDLAEERFTVNEELKTLKDSEKIKAKKSEITDKDSKILEIRAQIDKLQSEARESIKMNPGLENKLTKQANNLQDSYGNSENAFVMAGIDYEQKKLVVELTSEFDNSSSFENTSVAIAETIRTLVGDNEVIISVDTFEPVTCTNYLVACTPDRVGGVALYRADDAVNLAGSIGYKATWSGITGYVTAGHAVDYFNTGNRAMKQTTVQISNGAGYPFTKSHTAGDYSFQPISAGSSIIDDLWYGPTQKIDVSSVAISTDHQGSFVYKMGAGNGMKYGNVNTHWVTVDMWKTSASTASGDSGGPIYNVLGYSGGQFYGKIFGHNTYSSGGNAVYQPTDKLVAAGITPSTT